MIQEEEVRQFTIDILHSYFEENRIEPLIDAMAEDVIWMGSGRAQHAVGKSQVAQYFLDGKEELFPCRLFDEQYDVVILNEQDAICQGLSSIETLPGLDVSISECQKVTMVVRKKTDGLKIKHLHHAIAYQAVQEEELFPVQYGQQRFKELQEEIQATDVQIELMLSKLPGGTTVCKLDKALTTKWISSSGCELLGYPDAMAFFKATKGNTSSLINQDDLPAIYEELSRSIKEKGTFILEYRVIRADGSMIWIMNLGKILKNAQGEDEIYCFLSDITERKEQELLFEKANLENRQQMEYMMELFNTLPCGVIQFTVDSEHRLLMANRYVWEIFGFEEQELYNDIKTPLQFVLPEDLPEIVNKIDALKLNGRVLSYERKSKRKNGDDLWVNVFMKRVIDMEGRDVIQAIYKEITEEKKLQLAMEKMQRLEAESLRAAIDIAYPLIYNLNLSMDHYTLLRNDLEDQLEEEGEYDAIFQAYLTRVHPDYQQDYIHNFQRERMLERFAHGEKEIYMDLLQKGADGAYHWQSAHVIHVEDPYQEAQLAILLVKGIDDQKKEQLRQEQLMRDALTRANAANEAKSNFLSSMSHDIRTPMNAIIGMATIGQMKLHDLISVQHSFEKIDASSRYLLSLINDILDMSKIEQGKMKVTAEQFTLHDVLQELNTIIVPQAMEKNIRYDIRMIEPLKNTYIGDALHLRQILMNLLGNALKFTPENGRILVTISDDHHRNGYAYLNFSVKDTGIGISKEFKERLYQPFEQEYSGNARNNVGSGLGLSIVYNLVALMQGTIDVESEKGKGTEFIFQLPMKPVEMEEEAQRK